MNFKFAGAIKGVDVSEQRVHKTGRLTNNSHAAPFASKEWNEAKWEITTKALSV